MIVGPTVPHTGTRFLRDHLLPLIDCAYAFDQKFHVEHCSIEAHDRLMTLVRGPGNDTIIMLRHPMLVAESWKSRGKDVGELPDLWDRLVELAGAAPEPLYMPLDLEHVRGHCLLRIARHFDVKLETDWPLLTDDRDDESHLSRPRLSPHLELAEVQLAVIAPFALHRDFFRPFYG